MSWTIYEPVVRWLGDAARSFGPARGALVLYDALSFAEGDDPEAALWGRALDDWMYGDGDDDGDEDDEDDEDDCRGYPAGWISLQAERIAEEIYGPNFLHPIFPLGIAAYGGVIERLPRPPQTEAFFAQRIMVDVGLPTLFLALRRDGASLRIRGADHSHRDGAPAPESWATMDRAWGNRSFECVVPWDAFWAAYDDAWRGRPGP